MSACIHYRRLWLDSRMWHLRLAVQVAWQVVAEGRVMRTAEPLQDFVHHPNGLCWATGGREEKVSDIITTVRTTWCTREHSGPDGVALRGYSLPTRGEAAIPWLVLVGRMSLV